MTANDDLEKLAKDFVDLWQEHLAQQAADPALARWAQTWIAAMPTGGTGHDTTDGTSPASTASGDVGQRLDEFARRLAVCEERLDKLERKRKPTNQRKRGEPDPGGDRGGRR